MRILKEWLKAFGRWMSEIPYAEIAQSILKFIGNILHRALFTVLLPKRWRGLTKQEIYTIIFKSDTPAGKKFDVWLLLLIGLNIVVIMLESMAGTARWFAVLMRLVGWGFTILFTFEYYLRIYCLKKPWKYTLSFFGIIDFLSIFPAYLSLFVPAASTLSVLRLMRVLRIFRIFKMERFISESRFLLNSLKRSAVKIGIFMLFVFIMAIILGATMYGIEGAKNPTISSIPRGVYWAVVTITTVGYGDITPVTPMGQFISMVVMLLGYSIIAVPTGIVVGETLEERKSMEAEQLRHEREQKRRERLEERQAEREALRDKKNGESDPGVVAKSDDMM